MAFIEIDPINKRGKDLITLYQLYHRSYEKQIKNEARTEAAKIARNNTAIMKAFEAQYEGAFRYELCRHALFSSDLDIVDQMKKPIEDYLTNKGVNRFELYAYRKKGYVKMSTLCIERRIGIKAKTLEEVNHLSIPEARQFFRDGHAASFLSSIVIPSLKKVIGEEEKSIRILYSVFRTRTYFENIRVQILIPFEVVIETSDALDCVADKIKLLDQFQQLHPVLF